MRTIISLPRQARTPPLRSLKRSNELQISCQCIVYLFFSICLFYLLAHLCWALVAAQYLPYWHGVFVHSLERIQYFWPIFTGRRLLFQVSLALQAGAASASLLAATLDSLWPTQYKTFCSWRRVLRVSLAAPLAHLFQWLRHGVQRMNSPPLELHLLLSLVSRIG